jgi:hypothetical protein
MMFWRHILKNMIKSNYRTSIKYKKDINKVYVDIFCNKYDIATLLYNVNRDLIGYINKNSIILDSYSDDVFCMLHCVRGFGSVSFFEIVLDYNKSIHEYVSLYIKRINNGKM